MNPPETTRRINDFLNRYAQIKGMGMGTWLLLVNNRVGNRTVWHCALCSTKIYDRTALVRHARNHVRSFGDNVYALVSAGEIDFAIECACEQYPEKFK
jgi:hypothetical protein